VDRAGSAYRVVPSGPDGVETALTAAAVVNAAGLDADSVAAGAGFDVDGCGYRQHWARGHYFRVHPRRLHLAGHLIYPTPIEGGLGVHVTLDLAGGIKLGPDVEWLAEREQRYEVPAERAAAFHSSVSRYLDGLEPDDLAPDQAGIRAKLQGPGEPARDFVIAEESERGMPGWVNLIGIDSPGLTSCLAIGERVAMLLQRS
jgi:L-2-hydroxyglutarate oxidase LhgO